MLLEQRRGTRGATTAASGGEDPLAARQLGKAAFELPDRNMDGARNGPGLGNLMRLADVEDDKIRIVQERFDVVDFHGSPRFYDRLRSRRRAQPLRGRPGP